MTKDDHIEIAAGLACFAHALIQGPPPWHPRSSERARRRAEADQAGKAFRFLARVWATQIALWGRPPLLAEQEGENQ